MISFSNINKQYGKQLVFVDASFQLNPATPGGPYLVSSVWYIFAASIASGVSVVSLPLRSTKPPPYPSRKLTHTGTLAFLRPRATKPEMPLAGSFSFAAASTISAKLFGYARPLASNSSLL